MTTILTPSLEDYLETIYLLQQNDSREARVRDIAAARSVKASSVSPALKRLSELGYLSYEQREFIRLTEQGKIAARRVYARHILLFQFFHDILGMDEEAAKEEACGLEHALSDEGMDRFVRFFESRLNCLSDQNCMASPDAHTPCENCKKRTTAHRTTLDNLEDGDRATVLRVRTTGKPRQTILDMGILPNVTITRVRATKTGILIDIANHELELTNDQVKAIIVHAD